MWNTKLNKKWQCDLKKQVKHYILKYNANHLLSVETLTKFINYIMKFLLAIKIIEQTIIISYPKRTINIYKTKINSVNIFYNSPGFT